MTEVNKDLRVTVAICTRNRAGSLEKTLDSLAAMTVPVDTSWDLLVVDNGSVDRTGEVIDSFSESLPVRTVVEPVTGLSRARNAAVAAATGEYIVWTDDDVSVHAAWLCAYVDAFRDEPAAAVFGGPIEPEFEGTPPDWLRRTVSRVAGMYVQRDLGPDRMRLVADEYRLPYGANYAVRARDQKRFRYDVELGRQGDRVAMGYEETEVMLTILRSGGTGWWVPDARVRHRVPRERQTVNFVRQHAVGYGRYLARRALLNGDAVSPWPLRLLSALQAELWYRVGRLIKPPERWVPDLLVAGESWGRLARNTDRGKIGHD